MKKTKIILSLIILVSSVAIGGLSSMVSAQTVPSIIDINDGTNYSGNSKTLYATTYIEATCSLAYSKNSDTSNGTTVLGGVVQTPTATNDGKYYYAFNLTGLDGVSIYYYKVMCTANGQTDVSTIRTLTVQGSTQIIIDINDGISYSGYSKTIYATSYGQATCSLAYGKNSDTSNGTTVLGGVVQTPAVGNDQKYYYAFNLTGLDGVSVYYYKIMCTASGQSDISTIKILSPIITSKVFNGDGTYDINAGDRVKLNNGATIEPIFYTSGDFLNVKFDVYDSSLIKIGTSDFTRTAWSALSYAVGSYKMQFKVNSAGSSSGKYFGNITFTSVSANAFEITSVRVDKLDAVGNPAEDVRSFSITANQQFTNLQITLYELPSTTSYFTLNVPGTASSVYVSPGNWPKKLNPNKTYKYVISAKSTQTAETDTYESTFTSSNFTSEGDTITQITILTPNGAENFVQGNLNRISWSGGTEKVQIGVLKGASVTADATGNLLGWINTNLTPNSSTYWDGKNICDLIGTTCWDLAAGSYKIVGVSKDKDGNYLLNYPGNLDISDNAFNIIAPPASVPITSGQENIYIQRIKELEYRISELENQVTALAQKTFTYRNQNLIGRTAGRILLQVETNGQAWYLDPVTAKRYYLKDGNSAYIALNAFGLGVTNNDLAKIPIGVESRFQLNDGDGDGLADNLERAIGTNPGDSDSDDDGFSDGEEVKSGHNPLGAGNLNLDYNLATKLKGKILLQVQSKGEAWYVSPVDSRRYYLGDGESAYQIMRFLSLGITNDNLNEIPVGSLNY